MTLRDLIAADTANVILNTNDFAESVVRDPSGSHTTVSGVFFEDENETEGVRMGILKVATSTTAAVGDTWQIGSELWQTMWIDEREPQIQRVHVHLQLPDTVTVYERTWEKTPSGAQEEVAITLHDNVRCKRIAVTADLEIESQRREVEPLYRFYFEQPYDLNHSTFLQSPDGKRFRVVSWEQPEEFTRLFRADCEVDSVG